MEFWRVLVNVYHMHILPRVNQALCRCAALEKLPAAREMTGVSIDGYAGWIGPRSWVVSQFESSSPTISSSFQT